MISVDPRGKNVRIGDPTGGRERPWNGTKHAHTHARTRESGNHERKGINTRCDGRNCEVGSGVQRVPSLPPLARCGREFESAVFVQPRSISGGVDTQRSSAPAREEAILANHKQWLERNETCRPPNITMNYAAERADQLFVQIAGSDPLQVSYNRPSTTSVAMAFWGFWRRGWVYWRPPTKSYSGA